MRTTASLISVVLVASSVWAMPPSARLTSPPLPAAQWTPKARVKLAQAMAGEAGWLGEYRRRDNGGVAPCGRRGACFTNRDWAIIPYVLLRRWTDMHQACTAKGRACWAEGIPFTFAQVIARYCSPLKPHLASDEYMHRVRRSPRKLQLAHRRRFLQAIDWGGLNLVPLRQRYEEHLGRRARRDYYVEGWARIREAVEKFGTGELPDVCPKARHWDGKGAAIPPSLQAVDCGETLNAYSAPKWMIERWERSNG